MSSGGMFPTSAEVLVKSLSFLEARHRIIANNIANANTPSFKAQDAPVAEFRQALSKAMEDHRRNPSEPFVLSRTDHIDDSGAGLRVNGVTVPAASVLRHDGNNVNLEKEMTDLAENTLLYRMLSDLLRKQLMGIQSAIRERVE